MLILGHGNVALDIARILLSPLDLLRVSPGSVLRAVKAEGSPELLPAGWVLASTGLSKVSEEGDLPLLRVCFLGPRSVGSFTRESPTVCRVRTKPRGYSGT